MGRRWHRPLHGGIDEMLENKGFGEGRRGNEKPVVRDTTGFFWVVITGSDDGQKLFLLLGSGFLGGRLFGRGLLLCCRHRYHPLSIGLDDVKILDELIVS